ncbi:MAG: hypothetical protein NW226_01170 [Microscillaceae bacterium]|nr:hypothetical protein [Microscillaceae bacterium]
MKFITHIAFIYLFAIATSCGSSSEQTQESAKQDTSQATENEVDTQDENQPENNTEQADAGQEVTIGTFVGIDQGDYFYFRVKPDQGEELSLMVLQGDETYRKIEAAPDTYIGKKIKVYWMATKENLPEAGGEVDVNKYLKAEILE